MNVKRIHGSECQTLGHALGLRANTMNSIKLKINELTVDYNLECELLIGRRREFQPEEENDEKYF